MECVLTAVSVGLDIVALLSRWQIWVFGGFGKFVKRSWALESFPVLTGWKVSLSVNLLVNVHKASSVRASLPTLP